MPLVPIRILTLDLHFRIADPVFLDDVRAELVFDLIRRPTASVCDEAVPSDD